MNDLIQKSLDSIDLKSIEASESNSQIVNSNKHNYAYPGHHGEDGHGLC